MGKSLNKKAKRVLLTRQKLKELKPQGEQSEQTKRIVADSLKENKKVRYRGKARRVTPVSSAPKTAVGALGKGVLVGKLKEKASELAGIKKKERDDGPRPTIFKSSELSKEERNELVKKEAQHFEYVLNSDEFQEDPSAAVLAHIEATLDPIAEAKGRHRYNPSSKRKIANEKAKKEKAERSTSSAQLAQLSGFQSNLNKRMSPYESAAPSRGRKPAAKKPAPKSAGRKAGAPAKPWMQPTAK
eukprot:TRINITY_DN86_c1_g1_i2.p2 TRINITY_DN86_c1_g1~~TRINITY_DN86_c1_g1_i2.p2  ORF type:complete len:262 (+),score=72.39 TRINITY_DN86_c1_g1_i2:58-786(+)